MYLNSFYCKLSSKPWNSDPTQFGSYCWLLLRCSSLTFPRVRFIASKLITHIRVVNYSNESVKHVSFSTDLWDHFIIRVLYAPPHYKYKNYTCEVNRQYWKLRQFLVFQKIVSLSRDFSRIDWNSNYFFFQLLKQKRFHKLGFLSFLHL